MGDYLRRAYDEADRTAALRAKRDGESQEMSATDELRKMLDERGVEWQAPTSFDGTSRYDTTAGGYWFHEFNGRITIHGLTPEQAIEATLGRRECRNISKVVDKYGQARFACSECGAWLDSRMLWNPEYPNGESPFVKDCTLNFCPNCGRRMVEVDG